MGFDWTTAENAIYTWVKNASGLDDNHILWSDQNSDRPSGQFARLRLGQSVPYGMTDEVTSTYDALAPNGSQITQAVLGQRKVVLSVQVFGGPATGSTNARGLASKVQTALALPGVLGALETANLVVLDTGQVNPVSTVLDSGFESRALFEVTLGYVDDASETTTWIQHTEVTDTITGHVIVIDS